MFLLQKNIEYNSIKNNKIKNKIQNSQLFTPIQDSSKQLILDEWASDSSINISIKH